MDKFENRQIRIFISSTFQDMQAERDYLITKVFPRIQAEAAKYDVTIVPVDLRWGVTEEESKSGMVIQICLQEIENSHPFFIGLVGERYGWCPTIGELQKNKNLQERWGKWLEKDIEQGLSVTEIEMQYGVLRSKEKLNAYFYLKKDIAPNDTDKAKLEKLKTAIRKNGRYPYSEYSSPEDLGEQVERAFMSFLTTHYSTKGISELQKERLAQDAFLHSRTDVYIPNSDDFKVLDDFLTDSTQHNFVVTGESGLGKSALIANWVSSHRKNDNWNIIYHFVGNGGQEGDYHRILSRLCNEIRELYNLAEATDLEKEQSLTEQLNTLYTRIYEKKPLLIILDGINQLADIDNAKSLEWLPIPNKNVKNLFSTLKDDKAMTVFRQSNYPCYELLPLNPERKHRLISEYLHLYGKSLLPEQINKISHHALYNNTLFLRILLNELINFGQHEALNAYIDEYLQIQDAYGLFKKVINRYLGEYGVLVQKVLSLITASQKGLTENEILSLTGTKQLYWSQFFCAFKEHFTISNGLITFSHQYIYNTISIFFKEEIDNERDTIVEYFKKESSFRSAEELAFQFYQQKKSKDLHELLLNFDTFNYLYIQNVDKLAAYWKILVNARYSIKDYLKLQSNDTYEYSVSLERIGTFIERYFLNKGLSYEEEKSLRKHKKYIPDNYYDEYVLARTFKEKSIEIVKSKKGENSKEYANMCMSLAYTYWNTSGLRYTHGLGGRGTWIWYACKAMEIYNTIYSNYPTDYLINASKIALINTFGQSIFTIDNSQLGGIVNGCLEVIEHLLENEPSQFYNQYIYILLGFLLKYVPVRNKEISFSSRMCYEKALELCTQSSRSETIEKAFLFYCLSQDDNRQIEERTELMKKSMGICNNLYGEHHAFSQDLNIKYEKFLRNCEKVQEKKEEKGWVANLLCQIDKRISETQFGKKMKKKMMDSYEKDMSKLFGERMNVDPNTVTKIHEHMLNISKLLDSHWKNCSTHI